MGLFRFLPQQEPFFEDFREAAVNANEAAQLLLALMERPEDITGTAARLRDLEHRGDEITHRVLIALARAFQPPLSRNDIRDLAARLDDFVDRIEAAVRRLALYRLGRPTEPARHLARVIAGQGATLVEAISLLEDAKRDAEVQPHLVELHRLENEADEVLNEALATLYDGAGDIPAVALALRWGEIYHLLEDATDQAERIANTLEGIIGERH